MNIREDIVQAVKDTYDEINRVPGTLFGTGISHPVRVEKIDNLEWNWKGYGQRTLMLYEIIPSLPVDLRPELTPVPLAEQLV